MVHMERSTLKEEASKEIEKISEAGWCFYKVTQWLSYHDQYEINSDELAAIDPSKLTPKELATLIKLKVHDEQFKVLNSKMDLLLIWKSMSLCNVGVMSKI